MVQFEAPRDNLQLMMSNSEIDLEYLRSKCHRLFDYRCRQNWPPVLVKGKGWDDLYAAARGTLPVLQSVDETVAWTIALIESIENS